MLNFWRGVYISVDNFSVWCSLRGILLTRCQQFLTIAFFTFSPLESSLRNDIKVRKLLRDGLSQSRMKTASGKPSKRTLTTDLVLLISFQLTQKKTGHFFYEVVHSSAATTTPSSDVLRYILGKLNLAIFVTFASLCT